MNACRGKVGLQDLFVPALKVSLEPQQEAPLVPPLPPLPDPTPPELDEEILGSDDDEEDPMDYCKGGYHPVKIEDLFKYSSWCAGMGKTLMLLWGWLWGLGGEDVGCISCFVGSLETA
ncbi:Serine/threonine-protein kinase SRPK1 [Pteropus alecto]|uniref:Serine/threonine-protein kinase SRPK1 n=1 Tax=Pteropus alecto TaxID=9402 RepID=L5K607_PTEAL|nr:Serine/threonine-protein kinase SRPK1 [Pteropus alecto]